MNACLTDTDLEAVMAGRLDEPALSIAFQHLESCDRCADKIEAQPVSPNLSFLSEHTDSDSHLESAEMECQLVLTELISRTAVDPSLERIPDKLGPYRLLLPLGSGGMGTVYQAFHTRLQRKVAIKILCEERSGRPGWLERFDREMVAVAAIDHPHIVRALDAGEDRGCHYLVMELLHGIDLQKFSRHHGPLPLGLACEIVRQAASGLAEIHRRNLVHRDIKPSNLFLTATGVVKILDLGLVLDTDDPLVGDKDLTSIGSVLGTVHYAPPEQLNNSHHVDYRSDMYSLGATLFRLLVGKSPRNEDLHLAPLILEATQKPCVSLAQVRPGLPNEIYVLVDSLLSLRPEDRKTSATELASLLERFADVRSITEQVQEAIARDTSVAQSSTTPSAARTTAAVMEATPMPSKPFKERHRFWPQWIALALLPVVFVAGILITLETDRGTLVIRSDEPGLKVALRKQGRVIDSIQLTQRETKVSLRSGGYEIDFETKPGDTLSLSQDKFSISRGDVQIVEVRSHQATQATVDPIGESQPSSVKFYRGNSFDEWLPVVAAEQNLDALEEAIDGLVTLAATDKQKEVAAQAILNTPNLVKLAKPSGTDIASGKTPTQAPTKQFFVRREMHLRKLGAQPTLIAMCQVLETGPASSVPACISAFHSIDYIADTQESMPTLSNSQPCFLTRAAQSAEMSNLLIRLYFAFKKKLETLLSEWDGPLFSDIQSYYKPGQHLRQLFGRDIVYPILQIQLGLRDELHLSFRNNRLVRSWCQMRLEMLRFLAIEAVDKYAPHVDWTVSFAEKTIPYEHWEVLCPHWEVLSLREAKVCMEFHLLGPDEMFFVLEAILFRSTIADSPWNQTPLSDRTSLVKAIAEQVQRDPEKMAVAMKRCFARYLERQSEKNPGIGGMGGRAFNYSIDDDFETARLLCDNLKKSLNDEERTELEGKLLEPKVNDDLGWFRVAWLGNPPPENPVMRVDSDN